jgi:hypothetical protein
MSGCCLAAGKTVVVENTHYNSESAIYLWPGTAALRAPRSDGLED